MSTDKTPGIRKNEPETEPSDRSEPHSGVSNEPDLDIGKFPNVSQPDSADLPKIVGCEGASQRCADLSRSSGFEGAIDRADLSSSSGCEGAGATTYLLLETIENKKRIADTSYTACRNKSHLFEVFHQSTKHKFEAHIQDGVYNLTANIRTSPSPDTSTVNWVSADPSMTVADLSSNIFKANAVRFILTPAVSKSELSESKLSPA